MKKSVQELIDESMCRPGYRWNDTLKKCLGAGGAFAEVPGEKPPVENPPPAEGDKGGKSGRGAARVNANGVKQSGTSMGKAVPIK